MASTPVHDFFKTDNTTHYDHLQQAYHLFVCRRCDAACRRYLPSRDVSKLRLHAASCFGGRFQWHDPVRSAYLALFLGPAPVRSVFCFFFNDQLLIYRRGLF